MDHLCKGPMDHDLKVILSNIVLFCVAKCPLLKNIKVKIKDIVIMI